MDNIVVDHLTDLLRAGMDCGLHGVVDAAQSKDKRVNRARLTERLQRLCSRAVG